MIATTFEPRSFLGFVSHAFNDYKISLQMFYQSNSVWFWGLSRIVRPVKSWICIKYTI